jgi:hypothetical protein
VNASTRHLRYSTDQRAFRAGFVLALAAALAWASACAAGTKSSEDVAVTPATDPKCMAAMDTVRLNPRSYHISPPVADTMVLPPLDVPNDVRGLRLAVTFFVNVKGHTDSVRVHGVPASEDLYAAKLRKRLSLTVFKPGTLFGCAVPSVATMDLQF